MRAKWLIPRLLVCLASLSFTFLLFEALLRLPPLKQKIGDPPQVYQWMNQVKLSGEINSLGYRDREHDFPKPADTFRILILGDSFIYGQRVDFNKILPRVLERILNQKLERQVEVISLAQMGWNIQDELNGLIKDGIRFQPDLIIYGFYLNDLHLKTNPVGEEVIADDYRLLPWDKADYYLNNHSYVYALVRYRYNRLLEKWGLKISYESWQRNQYKTASRSFTSFVANLAQMKYLADKIKAPLVLVSLNFEFFPDWHRETALVLNEAKALSLVTLDMLPVFINYPSAQVRVSAIDGHPNALAHRLYAEALADFILTNVFSQ